MFPIAFNSTPLAEPVAIFLFQDIQKTPNVLRIPALGTVCVPSVHQAEAGMNLAENLI